MTRPKSFRYSLNQKLRRIVKWIMRSVTIRSSEKQLDIHTEEIKKILLVRATFRMGDSVLALPAISVFRKNFPDARIDFVGAPISRTLFRDLPIDHHFSITRRYPQSSWDYLALVKKLRAMGYDLAVDVSCSQSAMGSFIVGFSRARFRVGLQGEHDRWFNVRIPRPPEKNKYRILPAFLKALGLDGVDALPSLVFSSAEKEEGKKKLKDLIAWDRAPIVGVFVGGRKTWAKRWPIENFCELITALHWHGINVVTFFGPEEKNLIGVFSDVLEPAIPLIFEPSPRKFAAIVSNCDLFITCDSGPMHLACALGTRTVAIFQHSNFDHWGPPPTLARVVYQPGGCSAPEVLGACLAELGDSSSAASAWRDKCFSPPLNPIPRPGVNNALNRLQMYFAKESLIYFNGWVKVLFFAALVLHTWLFPPSGIFEDGTWSEAFTDSIGLGSLLTGTFLRIWAASYRGLSSSSQRRQDPMLSMEGPYAFVRHPIYLSSIITGLGLIFLLEAFPLIPFFLAWIVFHQSVVISKEEEFLKAKFGEEFAVYCDRVPKWLSSKVLPRLRQISLRKNLPAKEVGAVLGIIISALFFEWLESPLHHRLIVELLHRLGP